ncbi:hypothetical protein QF036_004986 [Arthrobacter globiformis]|nr:hypothetical protein [Arthrobacter globiformis]
MRDVSRNYNDVPRRSYKCFMPDYDLNFSFYKESQLFRVMTVHGDHSATWSDSADELYSFARDDTEVWPGFSHAGK